jgi:cell division protein FtsQ
MARGTLQDMAVPARKRSQPRHRYDVALNFPGAEVRLPSLPVVRIGWRMASAILVILMGLSLYVLLETPAFQVDVVEVEGLERLTLEDINSALNMAGESIVKVDPEMVLADLQAVFPELASIQVRVVLPARVKLEVVERQPIISWVQDGEEKWLDAEGIAFQPRGEAGSLIRVEADGSPLAFEAAPLTPEIIIEHKPMLSAEMISTLQTMGPYVPEGAAILFSTEHGFGWQDPNGWQAFFGQDLSQIDQKLLVYQSLQESLRNDGIEPSLISVEFLNAPFYRTER